MDKKIFMVYAPDAALEDQDSYMFVRAKNQNEAWNKAVSTNLSKDKYLVESFYERCVNAGFAELHYKDSTGKIFDDRTGEIRNDIKDKFKSDQLISEYIKESFSKSVRDFFKDNKDYAAIYLDYIINEKDMKFSDEMIIYMVGKAYRDCYEIEQISIIE